MSQAKVLMTVRGEFLKATPVNIEIQLVLFGDDESEEFKIFEIQIISQGHIFALKQHYCDEKTALEQYAEILKKLKKS